MTTSKKPSRYVQVAALAYQLTQATFPLYRRRKSKKIFTQPQLVACVLVMFYVNKSYRDFEEWLAASDQVCTVLGLTRIPDHSTLHRAFRRLTPLRLAQLLNRLLKQLKVKESVLAGDSTGYTVSHASAYYRTRSGKRYRGWIKGSYTVGTESQLILVARSSRRNSANDTAQLRPLRDGARPYRRRDWVFLGDAGFDSQAVTARDIIPPIRRGGRLVAPNRKARADLVAQARLDGLFGQRWKTETVHSVIKRKFGDEIRSLIKERQNREPIIKAVVYNLHR